MLFTNGTMNMLGAKDKELNLLLSEIKAMGVGIVPVGIGELPKLSELEQIASHSVSALRFGDYESPKIIGKAIMQGK